MTTSAPDERPQTSAQWAVRWHGVVVAAALLLSVPLFHVGWHGVLGRDEPWLLTRSQVPLPVPDRASVLDGSWMPRCERHLREVSPTVWRLRGEWNELLLRCGLVQGDRVALGRDGWLLTAATLRDPSTQFARDAGARRRLFAALRDAVRAAGAELVVSLVPDKARVHPEHAFADGRLPAGKAPILGAVVQELRELGITAVDATVAIAAARGPAAAPMYFERDTHWRPEAALAAAVGLAAVIEALPIAARLQPRRRAELGARSSSRALGDHVGLLGLLTCEMPRADGSAFTQPLSPLTLGMLEQFDRFAVTLSDAAGNVGALTEDPAAEVLLLGTSFSVVNGAAALAFALARPVRAVLEPGASGLPALRAAAAELRQGTRARVVVWEIVERGLFEADWAAARL